MSDLRTGHLKAASLAVLLPSFTLAADARHTLPELASDHIWEFSPGTGDSSALVMTTTYTGRVSGASLVPMWMLADRTVYAASHYHAVPVVTAFAPAYVRAEAYITTGLRLEAHYFCFDGQQVGGQYTLHNETAIPITLRLDMVGFVVFQDRPVPSAVVPHGRQGGYALRPCLLPGLQPVVVLRGNSGSAGMVEDSATRIGLPITVPAGGKSSARWVQAATADHRASLKAADMRHRNEWKPYYQAVLAHANVIPYIATGDADHDVTLAASLRDVLTAFVPLPGKPPGAVTGTRLAGQRSSAPASPALVYLTALAAAPADPTLAHGVLRHLLAGQSADGWIDLNGGGQGKALFPPLLARLAWGVFQYTEDDSFLREVYPGLVRFFRRWLAADQDADGDGIPEWTTPAQTGLPTAVFASALSDHPADFRAIESPDLVALLLSEAISLHEIGYYLREPPEPALKETIATFEAALATFWDDERGLYRRRDRDTHAAPSPVTVLTAAPGDTPHFIALDLTPPARITVTVRGGWQHTPSFKLRVAGLGLAGQPISETIPSSAFRWQTGRGSVTTAHAYTRIDSLHADGLIRLYKISAATPDLDGDDVSGLLPLYAVRLTTDQRERLITTLTTPATGQFLHENGVSALPANDAAYGTTPTYQVGMYWNTLLIEGLIEAGRMPEAADLAYRLLTTTTRALAADHAFYPYYAAASAATPAYAGERGHVLGAAPLHALMRVFGVRMIDAHRVWTGGPFAWPHPITVRQHGITVQRTATATRITFPSGRVVTLDADAPLQEIDDRIPSHGGLIPPGVST